MRNAKWCAAAIVTIAISACQTWGPTWSELTGARYTVVDPNREAAILIRAGDQTIGPSMPFKLDPGKYEIQVQSPVHNQFPGSIKTMSLNVEPCRRYYINAQFKDRVGPDWTPVIDYVERIAGCRLPAG
ncbi:MAG TPA: hypothetical protein VJ891_10810 [Casimicrobiaceae bacterium]|nr:hypothetical protein [Casimicrobiaceae bacterium]